ncbi:MAG TPA: HAD family hydrolase [Candidatus Didemnitutus sp.]|nr:HAD family hydrolase [Candidatus Didemnitutus sp.]
MASTLFTQNIIACIWDFDKTLIPAYMQAPLFRRFGVDEATFWAETNALAGNYRRRGYHISPEISYLNHLLTYVLAGPMAGLNNKVLRECGADIKFYPGLPSFFETSRAWVKAKPEYQKHEIELEHYIVSTGLAEMVRGSAIANYVDGIWACEFIENPLQPGFLAQKEFGLEAAAEIAQIGVMIDNTTKTRAIFEINKGTNKNTAIDVNAKVTPEDRRIPIQNMIYIADGPSDVPSFSVVRKGGGKTYAVYNPEVRAEFEQNDRLRHTGRIDHYGPADYTEASATSHWLHLQIEKMCDRIVADREAAVAARVARPPRHLNPSPDEEAARKSAKQPKQTSFLE